VTTTHIIAVLPILPGLLGLFTVIPALLAGLLAVGRALFRTEGRVSGDANEWLRFWLRQTPSLLVLTSLAFAAIWWWSSRPRGQVAAARSEGIASPDRWPMARGDRRRSGLHRSGSVPTAGPLEILWRFRPPGNACYSDPTPHGDRLYVVGSQGDIGTIYALSRADGTVAWSCRPPGYHATVSSPIVVDNVLYVGEGLHHVQNARIIAISVAGPRTGEVLWSYRVNGHLECTPTVFDRHLLITAGDDGVYCLRLFGNDSAPTLVWHAPGERVPDCDMALAIEGDRVYVGTGGNRPGIVVLDVANGSEIDYWPTAAPVRGTPCLANQRVLFATAWGDLISPRREAGRVVIRAQRGPKADVGASNDGMSREIPVPADVLGAIAADQTGFVCGSADGWVRAFDFQGNVRASWSSGAPITGAPVLSDGVLVVHNRDGMVFGLERQSLRPVWSARVSPAGNAISSPVAADGRIFLGTDDDGVVCLGRR